MGGCGYFDLLVGLGLMMFVLFALGFVGLFIIWAYLSLDFVVYRILVLLGVHFGVAIFRLLWFAFKFCCGY